MGYYHGARAEKQAGKQTVSSPVTADSGIHFIVGTAPVHTVGGMVNEPVLAYSYEKAVQAMGYSEEWTKYDICEEIYTSFVLYKNTPVVMVNVLDPERHMTGEKTEELKMAGGVAKLPMEALEKSVAIKGYDGEEELTEDYTRGEDYELIYAEGALRIERIEGGKITSDSAKISVRYNAVDPSKVTKADIIGGYDVTRYFIVDGKSILFSTV